MFATINDDPKSLEDILSWGSSFKDLVKDPTTNLQTKCPLLLATLSNFTICVKMLYSFGYRVTIPHEDEVRLQEMLKMKQTLSNDFHWYFALLMGSGKDEHYQARKRVKNPREFDTVERFLRFRAFVSPTYVSVAFTEAAATEKLSKSDPLRKMIAYAQYAKHLSNYYSQHRNEYKKIGKVCQDFVEDVLDQCENMDEVKTVLGYSSMNDVGPENDANWRLAVSSGQKEFVSHHYFQSFLWDKMTEDFYWDNYFLFWKMIYIPLSMFLLLCYPIIILLDLVFRDGDILFLSPKEKIKTSDIDHEKSINMKTETRFFAFFRKRMHRPIFRIISHIVLELLFLLIMTVSIFDPQDKEDTVDVTGVDVMTSVFVLSFFLDDVVNLCTQRLAFFSSYWNSIFFISHSLFVIGGIMEFCGFKQLGHDKREFIAGSHPANVGSTLVAIAATIAIWRTTRWLLLFRSFGPVIISIIRIIGDVFKLFLLFLITFVAFAIGTWSMFKNFSKGENSEYRLKESQMSSVAGMFGALFWRVFDPGQPEMAEVVRSVNGMESEDGETSLEFSHLLGITIWAAYQVTVVIILLNLLIAMMNNTFSKVSENADTEWKYSKSFYLMEFLTPKAALPAPFNLFYYPARWFWLCRKCSHIDKLTPDINQKRKEYVDLLDRLINCKMHFEYEDSVQDDFNGLRKDVKNMIDSKHSDVIKKMETLIKKVNMLESKFGK